MGYIRAEEVLPDDLIEMLQNYVDGEMVYIPRKTEKRKAWGTQTGAKEKLRLRNEEIYLEYTAGKNTAELSEKYYLAEKSIQRIIRDMKS